MIGIFLQKTDFTDADLVAERSVSSNFKVATLQIGQVHTASNKKINSLFRTYDMQPDGFDIGAVRIRKEGSLDFKYRMSIQIISQDKTLCNVLGIEALLNGEQKYNGSLEGLIIDSEINGSERENFIIFINLNSDNTELKNKQCDFNIVFKTYRNDPAIKKGLWSETMLHNIVTTGSW